MFKRLYGQLRYRFLRRGHAAEIRRLRAKTARARELNDGGRR